jgi:Trk K+ transport system NAD-binding subunit
MGGILTVMTLILVVRPLNIAAGTYGSNLNFKQKAFLAWVAPRGIVAAAIASLFAIELEAHGIAAAGELRAMVFLVIAVTVILAGITGGAVAGWLNLKRPSNVGWVILGMNEIGRKLAVLLTNGGEEVVCIDDDPAACRMAEEEGHKVIYGNAFEERTLHRAEIDTRKGIISLTANEEVNLLFAQKAKEEGKVPNLLISLESGDEGVTTEMVHEFGGAVLFARPRDLEVWSVRLKQEQTELQIRELTGHNIDEQELGDTTMENLVLPLVFHHNEKVIPVDDHIKLKRKDRVTFLINLRRREEAEEWFERNGWRSDGISPT